MNHNESDTDKFFATTTGKVAFSAVLLIIGFFIGVQYKQHQIRSVITDTLAPIVSESLNDARSKAADAKVQGLLSSTRAQGEIFYASTGNDTTYSGVCSDPDFRKLLTDAAQASGRKYECNVAKDGSAWAAAVPLKSNSDTYACSDSTGVAQVVNYPLGSATTCI